MPHNITTNDDVHGSTRLVVGANGGIGLALVKAQLARPDVSRIEQIEAEVESAMVDLAEE